MGERKQREAAARGLVDDAGWAARERETAGVIAQMQRETEGLREIVADFRAGRQELYERIERLRPPG